MDLVLLVNRATRFAPLRTPIAWNVQLSRITGAMRSSHRSSPVQPAPPPVGERLLPDYYAVLGVAPDATRAQIEQRYRYLVNCIHEAIVTRDGPGASVTQRRRALDSAVEVLRSPTRRADYNHWYAQHYPERLKAPHR